MPVALREAEICWEGPLGGGAGRLTSGSGALNKLGVTWASRTERPEGRTSPEELIAAAHASCFAMALALVLGGNRTPPERLAVKATCTLDEVDGAPRITTIELAVRAQVPGLEAADLKRMIESAGDLCPVSNALRGNVMITCAASCREAIRRDRLTADTRPKSKTSCARSADTEFSRAHGCSSSAERRTGPMGAAGEPSPTPSPVEGSNSSATTSTRSPTPRTDERPAP